MGRPGRKRQLEIEGEYWQLVLAGVGTALASRSRAGRWGDGQELNVDPSEGCLPRCP
jgi:hypothetical protein